MNWGAASEAPLLVAPAMPLRLPDTAGASAAASRRMPQHLPRWPPATRLRPTGASTPALSQPLLVPAAAEPLATAAASPLLPARRVSRRRMASGWASTQWCTGAPGCFVVSNEIILTACCTLVVTVCVRRAACYLIDCHGCAVLRGRASALGPAPSRGTSRHIQCHIAAYLHPALPPVLPLAGSTRWSASRAWRLMQP